MRIIIFLLIFIPVKIPAQDLAYKNKIANAIMEHESYFGKYLVNKQDTASKGYFQMRHCYVQEVNNILGYEAFKDTDRFDYHKSVLMFFYYNNFFFPDWDYRTISIVHAAGFVALKKPSPKALQYWADIQKIINRK
jgi:hypothetical protein